MLYRYHVKLARDQKDALRKAWWQFVLVAFATTAAGAIYLRASAPTPAPKPEGVLRLMVAASSGSTTDSDAAFAVGSTVYKLAQALHVDRRIEVWPCRYITAAEDIEGAMERRNADALLWLHATSSDGEGHMLYPTLYIDKAHGSPRRIALSEQTWEPATGNQFGSVVLQVALETADSLSRVLPDEAVPLVSVKKPVGSRELMPLLGEGGPVYVRLDAHVWSGGEAVAARAGTEVTEELVLESNPVRVNKVDEDGAIVESGSVRGRAIYKKYAPSVECVTYAAWVHNAGHAAVTGTKVSLPWPPEMLRARGMLTLNGMLVPDSGGIAELDPAAGTVLLSIGDLQPDERALATATYVVKWPNPTG